VPSPLGPPSADRSVRQWVVQAERDTGTRTDGLPKDERDDLDAVAATLNNRPLKTLDWRHQPKH
ncbi:MAG TPA: hypothetical protein VNO31_40495, partial [Umezawaea sp.]|nr:hypothetical protein [Umezawaea sp.]